ncbi:MAG TPA: DegT/DnrJ/EryC1/StrS family aminotransferase [Tepidiformaceae bacterium]|nr:DegT/DnrJ/EryC1/StrS family aminotransferase [Tepidiformaceae bacterium]
MNVPFVDLGRLHAELRPALLTAFERVLDSSGYVQGREVEAFEQAFAAQTTGSHAVAVSNGTAALHLALAACGIGHGDEVITVSNTFIATAEAITLSGATPAFADIGPGSFLIDPDDVERRITPRTRAIIAVHLYGEMADMSRLGAVARRHNLKLIEDACQAHGAAFEGRAAGTIGDVGCLSFYPTKNLGAIGEGGMVLTRDAATAARVRSLRDHGQERRHVHVEPGFNYRMSELQAAALRVCLPHLSKWNQDRLAAASLYREGLAGTSAAAPPVTADDRHVYHLFVVRTQQRQALAAFLASRGIGTAIHYPTPIHLQPAYAASGGGEGSLPETELAVGEILSLPMHPSITAAEVAAVCDSVQAFDQQAARSKQRESVVV